MTRAEAAALIEEQIGLPPRVIARSMLDRWKHEDRRLAAELVELAERRRALCARIEAAEILLADEEPRA